MCIMSSLLCYIIYKEVCHVLEIYSIYDDKAQSFNTPFFMLTDGLAMRAFFDLLVDPQSIVSKYPPDFKLYHIGSFISDNAEIKPISPPVCIFHGSAYKPLEK